MRGGTGITRQPHQILRLPRKMSLMIDLRHIWNVISNRTTGITLQPHQISNTAPATQKCTPKSKRNSPRTVEASIPTRGRFDHDPTMNSSSRTRPFAEVTFRASETHFVVKITTFPAPAVPATKSDTPTSPTQSTPCWKDSTQNAFFNIGLRNQQKCQIYWNRGGPFVLILVCKTNRPCVEKNQHIFYIIFTLIHLLFSWMHVSTCAELCWFWKNMPYSGLRNAACSTMCATQWNLGVVFHAMLPSEMESLLHFA